MTTDWERKVHELTEGDSRRPAPPAPGESAYERGLRTGINAALDVRDRNERLARAHMPVLGWIAIFTALFVAYKYVEKSNNPKSVEPPRPVGITQEAYMQNLHNAQPVGQTLASQQTPQDVINATLGMKRPEVETLASRQTPRQAIDAALGMKRPEKPTLASETSPRRAVNSALGMKRPPRPTLASQLVSGDDDRGEHQGPDTVATRLANNAKGSTEIAVRPPRDDNDNERDNMHGGPVTRYVDTVLGLPGGRPVGPTLAGSGVPTDVAVDYFLHEPLVLGNGRPYGGWGYYESDPTLLQQATWFLDDLTGFLDAGAGTVRAYYSVEGARNDARRNRARVKAQTTGWRLQQKRNEKAAERLGK